MNSEIFDVIIIGSGFGGLSAANILSKNGYKVCVLEQSYIYGGCFQSFKRKSKYIDTGIHYFGSMGEGQIMRQYFKYYGIFDDVELRALDADFEKISFSKEGEFSYYTGWDKFQAYFIDLFPKERDGIIKYCNKLKDIGSSISVDIHANGNFSTGGMQYLEASASDFIDECVSDPLLRNILAASNCLYAGRKDSSNLYHHAMINNSNIEGAYRFVGHTQKIVDLMIAKIRANGGVVLNNAKVVNIEVGSDALVKSVELSDSRKFFAKSFISNIHPANTFNIIGETPFIRKAYRTRFNSLENTYGINSVYLVMKPKSFKYINKNLYLYDKADVWDTIYNPREKIMKSVLVTNQGVAEDEEYADVLTLMSAMETSEFSAFENDKNYSRNKDYLALKSNICDATLDFVKKRIPDLENCIDYVCAATSLSYKRYTSSISAYGILKDYKTAMFTALSAKTKIKNLYLTGQNLNVHGLMGVSLSAAITCSEFLSKEYLTKEIARA